MDWQKLQASLPPDFWLKTAIFVGVIVAIVLLIRIYRHSNKMVLAIVGLMLVCTVLANWIYNRNEPRFLTPVIEKIAQFFPTKDYVRKDGGVLR
jgi:Mn2+/Fe2+ NRAMP family transporter